MPEYTYEETFEQWNARIQAKAKPKDAHSALKIVAGWTEGQRRIAFENSPRKRRAKRGSR